MVSNKPTSFDGGSFFKGWALVVTTGYCLKDFTDVIHSIPYSMKFRNRRLLAHVCTHTHNTVCNILSHTRAQRIKFLFLHIRIRHAFEVCENLHHSKFPAIQFIACWSKDNLIIAHAHLTTILFSHLRPSHFSCKHNNGCEWPEDKATFLLQL